MSFSIICERCIELSRQNPEIHISLLGAKQVETSLPPVPPVLIFRALWTSSVEDRRREGKGEAEHEYTAGWNEYTFQGIIHSLTIASHPFEREAIKENNSRTQKEEEYRQTAPSSSVAGLSSQGG